jgi:hypothetical protein
MKQLWNPVRVAPFFAWFSGFAQRYILTSYLSDRGSCFFDE